MEDANESEVIKTDMPVADTDKNFILEGVNNLVAEVDNSVAQIVNSDEEKGYNVKSQEVKISNFQESESFEAQESSNSIEQNVHNSELHKADVNTTEAETLQPPISFQSFISNGLKLLIDAIKISNTLPINDKRMYYKSFRGFNRIINEQDNKILCLSNKVLQLMNQDVNIRSQTVEEQMETIIEVNDEMFKKISEDIDLMNGIQKPKQVTEPEIQSVSTNVKINGCWNSAVLNQSAQDKSNELIKLLAAKNIGRPQTKFRVKVDNSNNPFVPKIKEKPNSIKPLCILPEETDTGEVFYPHPYEYELDRFTPSEQHLKKVVPVYPKPLEETPLVEVTTVDQLKDLLKDLEKQTQFAIDLEHHAYRTFMGITCLMQISTSDTDYLVDTLELRDDLYILNEVFTKPTILKIFHGADMDIQWLQRDLGLYVVNMFDTHQAAKQLNFARLSLAFLLERYCKVQPNKVHQLADWRIRPLPSELKLYARMDTHYLPYIYETLKNELIALGNNSDNILKSVFQSSTQICLKTYIKPIFTEESHLQLYHESKKVFNNQQMYAFQELYAWRDAICREEDESDRYVLPKYQMLQIASVLPREMEGILACCNPIPPFVKSNLLELHRIILKAREQPLVKPILLEMTRNNDDTLEVVQLDKGIHDFSNTELIDDLPTLIDSKINLCISVIHKLEKSEIMQHGSKYSIFSSDENDEEKGKVEDLRKLCPFERYNRTKLYVISRETVSNEISNSSTDANDEERINALKAHFTQVSEEYEIHNESSNSINLPDITSSRKNKNSNSLDDNIYFNENKRCREESSLRSPPLGFKKPRLENCSTISNAEPMDSNLNDLECGSQLEELAKIASHYEQDVRHFEQNAKKKRRSSNSSIKPFNYNSVNFQQFQGGAARNNRQPFQSKFKAKNKNKSQANFNKSSTYSKHQ